MQVSREHVKEIKYDGCIIAISKPLLELHKKIVLEIRDYGEKTEITYRIPLSKKKAKELAKAILEEIENKNTTKV